MATIKITPDTLNTAMEFDHVIRVNPDGTIDDSPSGAPVTPELIAYVNRDGSETQGIEDSITGQWTLLRGYSGQWGYSGPEMHPSEYIGGRMARDILENPGLYVVLAVTNLPDWDATEDETQETMDSEAGWAVCYIPAEDAE